MLKPGEREAIAAWWRDNLWAAAVKGVALGVVLAALVMAPTAFVNWN